MKVILASVLGQRVKYISGSTTLLKYLRQQIGQERGTQTPFWTKLSDICNPNPKYMKKEGREKRSKLINGAKSM